MGNLQTVVLFLTLFLCSSLTAQVKTEKPKKKAEVEKAKVEKRETTKQGVKAKIIIDKNGKQIGPTPMKSVSKEESKPIQSITVQNASTKFASATKIKKKTISQPKSTPVSIDSQIKSLEERIAKVQNSTIPNKEAELNKLKSALAKKKIQKTKKN